MAQSTIILSLIINKCVLVQHGANVLKVTKEKPIGLDATDQGCAGCSSKDPEQNKENISLSSSSDDENDPTISLDMDKKSNNIGYKGESKHFQI